MPLVERSRECETAKAIVGRRVARPLDRVLSFSLLRLRGCYRHAVCGCFRSRSSALAKFAIHSVRRLARRRLQRVLPLVCVALSACERTPLNYLTASGPASRSILQLTWGLTAVSSAVVVIITGLLLWAIFRPRADGGSVASVSRTHAGMPWIYIGVGISTVVLFICSAWSLVTLAHVGSPSTKPALSIEVIGHQWWWEVHYRGDPIDRNFSTANEIHIPVGQPVQVRLSTRDVIHSFWVPQLNGKTDTIPGQTNVTWLQADKPGAYYGQCTEYCGLQHAHMGLVVVAEPQEKFAAWWAQQLSAAAPPGGPAAAGQDLSMQHCSTCHSVRGTLAGGGLGPDLSHVAGRMRVPSGVLPNTRENLSHWVAHPQSIKPGALMPNPVLKDDELKLVIAYVETLK